MTADKLVFLPGLGFHATVMLNLAPYFRGKQLYFVDLPPINSLADIYKFAYSLPAGSALIGWSLGGLLGIHLCQLFPTRFSHLILLSSSPRFLADENWQGIDAINANHFQDEMKLNPQQTWQSFLKWVAYPSTSTTLHQHLKQNGRHDKNTSTLASHIHYLFTTDLRHAMNELNQPVLTLAGKHDAVIPDDHASLDAGHAAFYTHEELIAQSIQNFLEQT